MRNLKTSDLFVMSRIIKKMNIKNELKGLVKDVTGKTPEEKKKATQELEVDIAMLFVENIGNVEKEIYKFLADLSNKKAEDIENQPPKDTINMVKELFNQQGFSDFLSTASK